MKEPLELHLEGMAEDGDAIPKPSGVESYREVMRALDSDRYYLAHVQIDTSRFPTPATRQRLRKSPYHSGDPTLSNKSSSFVSATGLTK